MTKSLPLPCGPPDGNGLIDKAEFLEYVMADEDVDGATGVSNGGGHREMFRAVHRGPWRKHGLSSNVVALITSDRGQVCSTTAGTGKRSSGGRCDRKDRLSWGWHCAFLLLARDLTTWTILQDEAEP